MPKNQLQAEPDMMLNSVLALQVGHKNLVQVESKCQVKVDSKLCPFEGNQAYLFFQNFNLNFISLVSYYVLTTFKMFECND